MSILRDVGVAILERPHPMGHQGALVDRLVPLLRARGACVELIEPEARHIRLDRRPPWDLIVLKSGSPAARHVAAAAEAWGEPTINGSAPTGLAQDRLAWSALLRQARLQVPDVRLAWLEPGRALAPGLRDWSARPLIAKARRGSGGVGLWRVPVGGLARLVSAIPAGPYVLMQEVSRTGDDLKVYVAGPWLAGVERRFPARTLAEKRGRAVDVPDDIATAVRRVGALLGLSCYGCDVVRGEAGWWIVDVNAFPGYKGRDDAPEAIAGEIERAWTAHLGGSTVSEPQA